MKENYKDDNKEIDPYKVDKLSRVPSWLIVLILKYWAAAAAVFFSVIGGGDIGITFDDVPENPAQVFAEYVQTIVIIALALALVTNYIVRPIVRLLYNRRNNTYKFNMVNFKGFKSFLVSLCYCLLISIVLFIVVVFLGYYGLVFDPFGTTGGVGIEPFSYGIYFIVVDALFVLVKNIIVMIYERVKYNKQIKGE